MTLLLVILPKVNLHAKCPCIEKDKMIILILILQTGVCDAVVVYMHIVSHCVLLHLILDLNVTQILTDLHSHCASFRHVKCASMSSVCTADWRAEVSVEF